MAYIGMQFLKHGLKHYRYKYYRWNRRPGSLKFSHVCTDYKKKYRKNSSKLSNSTKGWDSSSIKKEDIRKINKERIKKLRILCFTKKHKQFETVTK